MNKKVVGFIGNYETGEVIGKMYEGDRIVRKTTQEYLKDTIELLPGESYTKTWSKTNFQLARCLSGTELQMVLYLLPYIRYESGTLNHGNGKPLNRTYISEETGLALKTVDRILKSLHSKQVIGKHNNGREIHFTINPWLFMRGKRINKTLYELFKGSRWAKVYE